MSPGRVVAATIVALALATGPAIGLLEIPDPGPEELGTGSATVEPVSVPDHAELVADEYTDVHRLVVPAIEADVSDITGTPIVTAAIEIEAIGYKQSSVFALDSGDGRQSFRIDPRPIDSERIDADTYRDRLTLVLRDGAGTTRIVDAPVPVAVVE